MDITINTETSDVHTAEPNTIDLLWIVVTKRSVSEVESSLWGATVVCWEKQPYTMNCFLAE